MKKEILVWFAGLVLFGCTQSEVEMRMSDYLPVESDGTEWAASDTVRTYVGDDLFILINGGAEMYHQNGFVQVVTQTFECTGKKISIELYEMKSIKGGTIVYESKVSPTGEKISIGDGATLSSYYLNFRQGRFVVTLVGYNDDSVTTSGLTKLAKLISTKIK